MGDSSLAEIATRPNNEQASTAVYRVLYDGQCEICQACVSWLKTLDHKNSTVCLPISAEVLSAVDSRLKMDECLRQLRVCSRLPGSSGHWDRGSHSEMQDGSPTASLPRTDIRSASVAVVRAT
jgi:hypothetical protein